MNIPATEKLPGGKLRGFSALGRSYAADLKAWAARLAAGYGVAAALLVGGLLAVFGAMAVGGMALFHFIEFRYGTNAAFAVLGCGLLAPGAILLLAGLNLEVVMLWPKLVDVPGIADGSGRTRDHAHAECAACARGGGGGGGRASGNALRVTAAFD